MLNKVSMTLLNMLSSVLVEETVPCKRGTAGKCGWEIVGIEEGVQAYYYHSGGQVLHDLRLSVDQVVMLTEFH